MSRRMADVDVAFGSCGDADRELDRKFGAVGAQRRGLDQPTDERTVARLGKARESLGVAAAQALGNDDVGEKPADDVGARVAERAFGSGVELDDATVAVHADDAVEGRLDGRAQARLAALQLALALTSLGDVSYDGEHVRLTAIADRDDAQVGLEAGAVGA